AGPAVRAGAGAGGRLVFCPGQTRRVPDPGGGAGAARAERARRCLENLRAVCDAAGTSLERAVRVTVYLTDLAAFAAVNEVYASFFAAQPPARVTLGAAQLAREAYGGIDAIVLLCRSGRGRRLP